MSAAPANYESWERKPALNGRADACIDQAAPSSDVSGEISWMVGKAGRLVPLMLMWVVVAGGGSAAYAGAPTATVDPRALFAAVGKMYGVDPELLQAIATAESGGDAHAVSARGAAGLMQLMPATAARFGVSDSFDPVDNVLGAVRLLSVLQRQYGKSLAAVPLLLAAYNAGEQPVARYGGVPPYPETRAYVRRVLWLYLLGVEPPRIRVGSANAPQEPAGHHRERAYRGVLDQLETIRRARAGARVR